MPHGDSERVKLNWNMSYCDSPLPYPSSNKNE